MAMTISIDDELKDQFCAICHEMGLTASAAFTVFAKTVVRERRIPFEISSESEYERRRRAYERSVNDALWQGYREYQDGLVYSLEDIKALRDDQDDDAL